VAKATGPTAGQQLGPAGYPPDRQGTEDSDRPVPVGPEALADLINRVGRSELNTNQGREVLTKMIETGEPVEAIIEAGGYKMVSDRGTIVEAIEAALASNPKPWKT